jgi:hypothetical protein
MMYSIALLPSVGVSTGNLLFQLMLSRKDSEVRKEGVLKKRNPEV